jgi:hypothetical protein
MRIVLLSALSVCVSVLAQTSVDSYIATESPIAKAGVLANIGPSGSKSQGAKVTRLPCPSVSVILTLAANYVGWGSHRQSKHHQPGLPVYMDSRLLSCVQGPH